MHHFQVIKAPVAAWAGLGYDRKWSCQGPVSRVFTDSSRFSFLFLFFLFFFREDKGEPVCFSPAAPAAPAAPARIAGPVLL
jgi:hypothetical protein